MRPKALFAAAAAAALLLAACNTDTTGPGTLRHPGPPSADGTGMFGSGGATPPPDTTAPHP